MGLTTAFLNFSKSPMTTLKILWMKLTQIFYLLLRTITCHCLFKNKVVRKPQTGIPQPKHYNTWSDIQAGVTIFKVLYIKDLSERFEKDRVFDRVYSDHNYDAIVKAFCPTKSSAFESVNIQRTWEYSYWNPFNRNQEETYKKSDLLFADMLVNTQGIYKARKIRHDTIIKEKAVNFFEAILEKNRDKFNEGKGERSILDELIDNENLFYLDYPVLRELEQNEDFIKDGKKYYRMMQTTSDTNVPAYIEVPFAIFAKVPNYTK